MNTHRSGAGTRLRTWWLLSILPLAGLVMSTGQAISAVEDNWSAQTIQAMKDQQGSQTTARKQSRRGVRVAALGSPAYEADEAAAPRRASRSRDTFRLNKKARRERSVEARTTPRKSARVRVASLGRSMPDLAAPSPSLSGGIRWVASSGCLAGSLRGVLASIASNFGPVTVTFTCRSAARNRSVGGARRSMHLTGNAADFRVHGNRGAVMAFLRSSGSVGGLKHYGGGLFHIDTGARRSW